MVRASTLVTLLVGTALAACRDKPTATVSTELEGLWNLAHQETPAIYGLVSAQVIFRPDATFLFVGVNPLSMSPLAEFTVSGTWQRAGDLATLRAGDEPSTWRLEFENGSVRFTDPVSGHSFRLFRPLPD